jgi:NAD(P)-dependent dehydrogenase (short-subunit alcohol dehydrogenase family)
VYGWYNKYTIITRRKKMLLENRVAIVTGGAVGIGRGIALKFAENGCSVVICDINEKEGQKTADEISQTGRAGVFAKCDVTDSRQVKNVVDQAVKRFGKIDIIVNNAGGVPNVIVGGSIVDVTDEMLDRYLALNLKSTFYGCRAVVPYMKEKMYGKIINLSSIGAIQPSASVTPYHAAKGGVLGLTTNLAFDLAPYNIYVNAILPGPIRTPFWEPVTKGVADKDALFAEIGKKNVPLQRIGTPEDIAGVALFLASDLSNYVTGESINAAGGIPLLPQESKHQIK